MSTEATAGPRPVRAPRGTEISCKGWQQEAALRMLMNNLDPEVAEAPDELIVYGGAGKAARNWESFDAIVRTLRRLKDDETLLVQSGKPVGVFQTHEMAPRVLIANANLVGDWANWDEFRRLDALGLTMYGQMTAGSWIYIGTQGILQGTYQTFAAAGQKHYGADLAGKLVLTAGLGGMGGAQPLAVTMAGGVALCVEVDPHRIERRLETAYVDVAADSLDEALKLADEAMAAKQAALHRPARQRRGRLPRTGPPRRHPRPRHRPDVGARRAQRLRAQRHDARRGAGAAARGPGRVRAPRHRQHRRPRRGHGRAAEGRRPHVRLRQQHPRCGEGGRLRRRLRLPRLRPGLHPAAVLRAATGRSAGRRSAATRRTSPSPTPPCSRPSRTTRWSPAGSRWPAEKVHFQGLPCRICWLEYGERAKAGEIFNDLVRTGKVKAPLVIGRDHLDSGSVASPYRETESMMDGSDAIADWPILNALLNTAAGASWVSFHHGGGVGIGKSLHAGMVVVADGTDMMGERLRRVLTTDPGTGVMRHADAGYPEAIEKAKESGIDLPMCGGLSWRA